MDSDWSNKENSVMNKFITTAGLDKIERTTTIIILVSIAISVVFLVVQSYNQDDVNAWYAATTYINIILIIFCFILYIMKYLKFMQ